jgi:hypothetical protein
MLMIYHSKMEKEQLKFRTDRHELVFLQFLFKSIDSCDYDGFKPEVARIESLAKENGGHSNIPDSFRDLVMKQFINERNKVFRRLMTYILSTRTLRRLDAQIFKILLGKKQKALHKVFFPSDNKNKWINPTLNHSQPIEEGLRNRVESDNILVMRSGEDSYTLTDLDKIDHLFICIEGETVSINRKDFITMMSVMIQQPNHSKTAFPSFDIHGPFNTELVWKKYE